MFTFTTPKINFIKRNQAIVSAILVAVMVSGCSAPGPDAAPGDIFDPNEARNRKTHAFNRGVDRALLKPAGAGYTKIIPEPVQDSIGNFASNLALPGAIVNNLLQGNIRGASQNTARFLLNSTLGFAGLADAGTAFHVPAVDTNFGETLAVWGVREGAYVELPFLGPSTERDTAGKVVDLFTNPLSYIIKGSPEKYLGTVANGLDTIGDRGRYSETIDSILYDSADSYAQARLIYLQNSRFDLGVEDDSTYVDPYDDLYAE